MSNGEMVSSSNVAAGSNGKVRPGPGRPPKKQPQLFTVCAWCESSGTTLLNYVWENEKKEFCSKMCIAQFRAAHIKGVCLQCDNVLTAKPLYKEFCSAFCQNKYQRANATLSASAPRPSGGQNNNNNNNVNNNHLRADSVSVGTTAAMTTAVQSASPARAFQYESLHVFNWEDYLQVSFSFYVCVTVFR